MHKLSIAVEAKTLATLRTGVGQYTYQLYRAMSALPDKSDIYYRIDQYFTTELPNERFIPSNKTPLRYKEKLSKSIDRLATPLVLLKKKLALYQYRKKFNHDLKKIRPDIIHCTDFFSMNNPQGIPEIITVYDLSCFKYPETHPEARVRFFNDYLPASLERAQHILTISEFSKQEIVDYFSLNPDKITVTYCGLPNGFQYYSQEQLQATLKHYNLKYKKYFLYVGTIEPRKNLMTLLEAYQQLPKAIQAQYKLVIIGSLGWKFEHFLQRAQKLLNKQQLIMPGYVPDQALQHIMAGAHCFLYPSLYEGFGIPPLEAMASGTPVITSSASSLPEVIGQAGILLPPNDSQEWTKAIINLIENPKKHQSLVDSGKHRARLFNWTATAEKTRHCFQIQALKTK